MTIDKEWAIDCLKNSKIKTGLFKVFNYFKLTEPVEFIKFKDGFNSNKVSEIGGLLYDNREKFPQIFAAPTALLAGNLFGANKHPCYAIVGIR